MTDSIDWPPVDVTADSKGGKTYRFGEDFRLGAAQYSFSAATLNAPRVVEARNLNAQGYLARSGVEDKSGPQKITEHENLRGSFGVLIKTSVMPVRDMTDGALKFEMQMSGNLRGLASDADDANKAVKIRAGLATLSAVCAPIAGVGAKTRFEKVDAPPTRDEIVGRTALAKEKCADVVMNEYKAGVENAVKQAVISPATTGFSKTGAQMAQAVELCVPGELAAINQDFRENHMGAATVGAAGAVILTVAFVYHARKTMKAVAKKKAIHETMAVRIGNYQTAQAVYAARQAGAPAVQNAVTPG